MMDKQQAKQLIQETFENSFDKNRYSGFVRNLLNQIEDAPLTYQGNYIPEKFRQYIKTLERIGKYSDSEHTLDILIITLQKETSLERARTMQRNFIAWYLNGSRPGGGLKDAALVAYVSLDQTDWRFSLVKMDYKFEKTESGKMKVKEEFTPARRWSFLVGVNEKSHTAQSRLVKILADDEHAPTLTELEKAFDIETVTKEFFLKYRELFLCTKEGLDKVVGNDSKVKTDFDAKGVDTVNFAKKLLGQIVFLYFLQKKGWFGVGRDDDWGTGSKHFLRGLFEKTHGDYTNFFNDILEPLFYEALRIGEERKQDDYYYSRFNCKIPFLNGGLFDPIGNYDWVHTDIHLSNDLFSNTRKTKEGDIGDGILDVFDRYNFTVREDEPLEKEVAIDPELLGKAYEKFNAIRPDNFDEFIKALKSGRKGEENKFNKKFGVYYTPREIVHYMCKQSLINYLHTEVTQASLSDQITRQDIEDLIEVGELITEHEATALIKEQNIRDGIQKSTEYTALLSDGIRNNAKIIDDLLADITVCDPAAGSGAFPVGMMNEIVRARNVMSVFLKDDERSDYEFKRRCIEHSLYGVDIDPGAVEIAKLRLWLSLVVDEEDIKNIKPLPNLDYKIVCGNSLLGVEKDLFNHQLFDELEKLKPVFFSETNPTKKKQYKKQIDDLISRITNGHTEFDFEVYFSEVFHDKGGFDVVVANPPYVNIFNIKEEKFRKYLMQTYKVAKNKTDLYAFFIEKSVSVLRDHGELAFIFSNSWLGTDSFSEFRKFLIEETKIEKLVKCPPSVFEEATVTVVIMMLSKEQVSKNEIELLKFTGKEFRKLVHTLSYNDIKEQVAYGFTFDKPIKINIQCVKLGNVASFSLGIKTANDKKFILESKKDKDTFRVLRGKDMGRYFSRFGGKWIWYKPDLMNQRKGAGPRKLQYFQKPKILIRDVATEIQATLDTENHLTTDTISILHDVDGYDLKFILAILNSKTINKWFKLNFAAGLHIKTNQLAAIPLPTRGAVNQKPIVDIVDIILAITKSDDYQQNPQKQARVKELEQEIDQMVYQLYDLTEEEIRIVEGRA